MVLDPVLGFLADHPILTFLVVLNAYLLVVYVLRKRGAFDGDRVSLFGPALMLKTERGKGLIERLARPKDLWKRYGDATIVAVVVFGVLMVLLLAFGVYAAFDVPQGQAATPREVLAIPGLNPFIPLGYGIMALAIAIVIHEFAHGILARAHDLKVKSLGVLLFIVPIGAFMEPDEDELMDSHPRTKTRVFAAGAGTSILISFVFAAVFSYGFVPMAQPAAPGMGITQVSPESPADGIGIEAGMILTAIDGDRLDSPEEFVAQLNGSDPGDRVRLKVYTNDRFYVRNVTLVDRYEYVFQRCLAQGGDRPTCHDRVNDTWMQRCQQVQDREEASCRNQLESGNISQAFLGVGVYSPELFLALNQPSLDPQRMFAYLFLPVVGFSPINSPFANFFVIQGPLAALGMQGFWMLANSFYWLFWINFLLGTFNALPLTVLDGGHVFNEGVRKVVRKVRPEMPKEQVDLRVQQSSKVAAILIVGALAAQLVIPYLI